MNIIIMPNIGSLMEDYGYDTCDDFNEDGLLFQQGFDGFSIEVEDGERFEIPDGHIGTIGDEDTYYMFVEVFPGVTEKEEFQGYLNAGFYRLKNKVISRI